MDVFNLGKYVQATNLRLIKHPYFAPLLYMVLSVLVFFFVIVTINTYALRLKVETAVVNAEIETMVAPMNGYITDVFVASGALVKKGTPLIKIENINLERELQFARVQADDAKLNIEYYQQLLTSEQQRLKIYRKIGHNRVISAQSKVNISKQAVETALHEVERFTVLHKKNYVSKSIWEQKLANFTSAQEQLRNAKAEQRLEAHSLKAVDKGMYFTGTKTEGVGRDLLAELEIAKKRASLNEDRVKIYEGLISKLTLKAPFDGKITQLLKSVGNTTDTIKPILLIEKASVNKNITAYLSQKEVLSVGLLQKVKLYIPASGQTYRGKIIEINRTDGFVDEINAQYRWRDFQVDRSAKVTIAILDDEQKAFNQKAFSGLPVIVYFSKKFAPL